MGPCRTGCSYAECSADRRRCAASVFAALPCCAQEACHSAPWPKIYFALVSLRIRLSRVGAKKQASYRIVVAESVAPRDGKFIAILGHYNPLTDPYTLKVDEESAVRWLR